MNPAAPLIAVVEDEDHLAQGLLFNLKAEGYRTHHEADGTVKQIDLSVTSSAGVASLHCCGPTKDKPTLLRIADQRLYRAKEAGRNRVVGN